jgi:hypothetical protein
MGSLPKDDEMRAESKSEETHAASSDGLLREISDLPT